MGGMRRRFEIGRVLGRTFPIWLRNFVPFMILSLVIYSPMLAFAVLAVPDTIGGLRAYRAVLFILGWLLGIVVTGALVFGVFRQLRGQPAGLVDCLRVGLARLFPVLAVGILVGLIVAIPLVLAAVLGGIFGRNGMALAVLIAVVPAISLFLRYWVSVPVAVVERPGVVASLRRSADLTRGNKGSIFVVLLVLGVLQWVVDRIVGMVTPGDNLAVAILVPQLVTIALGALMAVANAVGYHDLRVAKEGVGIEELLKVFD